MRKNCDNGTGLVDANGANFRSGTLIRPSATYTIVWYRTPAQRGITSSSMSNGWGPERLIASRSFALNPDSRRRALKDEKRVHNNWDTLPLV